MREANFCLLFFEIQICEMYDDCMNPPIHENIAGHCWKKPDKFAVQLSEVNYCLGD